MRSRRYRRYHSLFVITCIGVYAIFVTINFTTGRTGTASDWASDTLRSVWGAEPRRASETDKVESSAWNGESGGACSPLSIACLAESKVLYRNRTNQRPASWKGTTTGNDLSRWTVLAGHSRMRAVYLALVSQMGLQRRTRGDLLPPVPDLQVAYPSAGMLHRADCLVEYVRPDGRTDVQEHKRWCSMAASDRSGFLLDFRWRTNPEQMSRLLGRLLTRPPRLLVITFGLHEVVRLSITGELYRNNISLDTLQEVVETISKLLAMLRRRGTSVVWMLEYAKNREASLGGGETAVVEHLSTTHYLPVLNMLFLEAAMAAGVDVWTAHLPLVTAWILQVCRPLGFNRPDPVGFDFCFHDQLHADPDTVEKIADQLATYIAHVMST